MQRAVWTAAEILSDYQEDIESFDLEMGSGGDFEFSIDGELIYSKRETGEYPDIKVLKMGVVNALEAKATAAV
ncbi:MAG: Rdx family protein [Dehalococcoidia bacterium]|jgi:selenoprotein W-related protein|nr:Rdx family protein [Dehalococcoidia bacterium]